MRTYTIFSQASFFITIVLSMALSSCEGQPPSEQLTMNKSHPHQNRLSKEKSPYLLQHADNPVDWYPWGSEAFEKAKKEDKPVFLSIGYSTCHWCHVMEHESFENEDIARMINQTFIPIKVDREERPDIDNIYMTAVQAMTGHGGWPLTVLLTPDKKPFWGGTYLPPHAKWGSVGLTEMIQSVDDAWRDNREKIIQSGDALTKMLRERTLTQAKKSPLNKDIFSVSYRQLAQMYDARYGGFGQQPKFPTTHNLSLLLRFYKSNGDAEVLNMVEHTLKQMAGGGMYDHVGFGFHRYSTDPYWQIPHFEKMLYDQAIIARTYLESYQVTKDPFYARIAREIFEYVLRDMRNKHGGFYSAEDADSYDPYEYRETQEQDKADLEKSEGAFYLWKHDEIIDVLGSQNAAIFNYHFGIEPLGNARNDPHGEFIERNVVFVDHSLEETAKKFNQDIEQITNIIETSKKKLFDVRLQRPHPYLDDKILVDWNGLMIASLAFGARVLDEPKYARAAQDAADFILEHMISDKGRLLHRYRDGDAAILATIEDYAFFINGLVDLYEANFNVRYLSEAERLAREMVDLFWDDAKGGFFFTAKDSEALLYRHKEIYDGAIPSGNSLAALALIRLNHITLNQLWGEKVDVLFQSFSQEITQNPSAYSQMLIAFDFFVHPSFEIVLAGRQKDVRVSGMIEAIYDRFIPNKVLVFHPESGEDKQKIVALAAFVEHQNPIDGRLTVYVCENHVCKLPVVERQKLKDVLPD